MSKSLKEQAVNGVVWSAIERFSVQGVQFVLSIIIARLVAPSEYGLIAMLGIFMAIAYTFIDSGFSNALIQKKDRSEVDFSTVFYFNIAIAVVVYIIIFFASPFIAEFYNEPLLDIVTKWVGLNLIISGLTIVQRAKLSIALDFKTQAKASLIGVVLGGVVGVTMAYYGYGVWALVAQALTSGTINSLLLWVFAKWKPSFVFSIESFKTLFSFGSKLLASGLIHTIYINLYSLVIGKQYSATDVGYYNRAGSLAQFPSTNIVQIITRAIYPLQCQMQDDNERLSATFHQYLRLSCFIVFPLMVGLAAVSKPLILLMLTERWLPAAEPLSILCLAYMWYPVMVINHNILKVKGRSDYYFHAEVIKKVIAISILLITMPFGLKTLCWGVFLYNIADMIIIIWYSKKVVDTGFRKQIVNIAPLLAIGLIMGAISYLLPSIISNNPALQLLCGTLIGFTAYFAVSYIFKIKELDLILSSVNKYIKWKK